jgi:hypothetical protein
MERPVHGRHSRALHRSPDPVKDRTLCLLKRVPPENSETESQVPLSTASRPGEAGLTLLNPSNVLRELFELLEDYAPAWYTEENHDRALAALARVQR